MVHDWRSAALKPRERGLCEFAAKLTHRGNTVDQSDIEELRSQNWSDRAIHDAVQVVSFFNYITRIADGLGVEHETFIKRWGEPEP